MSGLNWWSCRHKRKELRQPDVLQNADAVLCLEDHCNIFWRILLTSFVMKSKRNLIFKQVQSANFIVKREPNQYFLNDVPPSFTCSLFGVVQCYIFQNHLLAFPLGVLGIDDDFQRGWEGFTVRGQEFIEFYSEHRVIAAALVQPHPHRGRIVRFQVELLRKTSVVSGPAVDLQSVGTSVVGSS